MPEGPFGGPRPFADSEFLIIVGFENGDNVMDKLLIKHQEEDPDIQFSEALQNFENKTFSRILDISDAMTKDILMVRVVDQLEITIQTDAIAMQELVDIGRMSKRAVESLLDEEPVVVVRID